MRRTPHAPRAVPQYQQTIVYGRNLVVRKPSADSGADDRNRLVRYVVQALA
jgi:hypothetical protein